MTIRAGLSITAALGVGALASWLVTKDYYKKNAKEEIKAVREYYQGVVAANEHYTRDLLEYENQVRDLEYAKESTVEEEEEEVREPEEDLEELRIVVPVEEEEPTPDRDVSKPYIISDDEYSENAPMHFQAKLSYWEDDDVLTDENEMIVTDSDGTVGDINLSSFGDDPKDPDVIYVRNEPRDIDFEINRIRGSYEETVVGFKHADDYGPKIRKMRFDD